MGLQEKFNRPEKAPTGPYVSGWPTAKEIAIAQKSDPSTEWGFGERFNRPETAPTTAEVKNWPLSYAQKGDTSVAYGLGEGYRPTEAPAVAQVKDWPYPQYAQKSNGKDDREFPR